MSYFEMAAGVSVPINYIDLGPVWPLLGNVTGFRSYTRLVSNELKPNDLPRHPKHLFVSRCDAATVDVSNVQDLPPPLPVINKEFLLMLVSRVLV